MACTCWFVADRDTISTDVSPLQTRNGKMKGLYTQVIVISLIIASTSALLCTLKESSHLAKWYNPSGLCTNCYCQWQGYKYCYGGCNNQKLWYKVQLTTVDPFSAPDLDNLYYCNSAAEIDDEVTVNCYDIDTDQIVISDVSLIVKEPTACVCGHIGGSGGLPALTTGDIDDAKESISNYFDGKTEEITTITH